MTNFTNPEPTPSQVRWLLQTSRAMSRYLGKNVNAALVPHPDMLAVFQLSKATNDALLARYALEPRQPFANEHDPAYAVLSRPNVKMYDAEMPHKYISDETKAVIKTAIAELRQPIQDRLKYHFSIVNVRLFELFPGGRHTWHTDHFPAGIYKILIYLSGASEERGTTCIRIENTEYLLDVPPGGVCLFDSNNLEHVALSPKGSAGRITMEITIAPSLLPDDDIPQPGLIATFPEFPPE